MLKTAVGKASDLEAAIAGAIAEFNNSTGTKEYHSTQFLIDGATNLYLVIIMYTAFEQTPDLPPVENKGPFYIGSSYDE
jgi:hypothetical protein